VIVRILVIIVGLTDALAGAALLVGPRWFFDNVGPFAPYNPHYLGDAGAFLLPVGIGLLVAAVNPRKYMALLVLGMAVSVLHFLNHLDGSVSRGESWLQTFEVGVIALAMVVAAVATRVGAQS
jgi:hypothetical protein